MHSLFLLLLVVAVLLNQTEGLFGIGRMQSVAVTGAVECNGSPMPGVGVKLSEKDLFFDTDLDEGKTDKTGSFYLYGSKREITTIDPRLYIYHKCNYHGMQSLYLLLLVTAALLNQAEGLFGVIGRMQSVAVTGAVECNGSPMSGVAVKLNEKEIFFDTELDEGKTDKAGSFYLYGGKRQITTIDPKLYIYHKCNYHGPCYKKIGIEVPSAYVVHGRYPQFSYNVGMIKLGAMPKGETVECLN
ncbi:unnamed protein product [Cylicocyclus nassatus]|uniref:Transthyretin-like family protein n=1 Tax=Cylicocyclus nassatus TaxID=53992 RepID=A0AA36M9N3_CYLNA|nr:unnamed protein product [Cylicocyclus nassatus]